MSADNIVICDENTKQVEENLESWRYAFERRGMKVSAQQNTYVNVREAGGTMRLQEAEATKVQEFKYLFRKTLDCGKEVKRDQAGWI